MNVNCYIIVGLGETDCELADIFFPLKDERIAGYLFSFNPEAGTATQDGRAQPSIVTAVFNWSSI